MAKKGKGIYPRVRITSYIDKEYGLEFFIGMTGDLIPPIGNKDGVIACVRLDPTNRVSGSIIDITKEIQYEVI